MSIQWLNVCHNRRWYSEVSHLQHDSLLALPHALLAAVAS